MRIATALAARAFPIFKKTSSARRAAFLRRIADDLEAAQPALIERAALETALPNARLAGEIARTANQLPFSRAKSSLDCGAMRASTARDANRQPLAKPDLRSMQVALGPVVVFGASNFPFAYSVAGGDTASALAAGCPVIVKAHPAHAGTSALVGQIICEAARASEMPDGVFSLLFDGGLEIGQQLVQDPQVCAVGFTGCGAAVWL